ncbi:MAG: helix-turn-helix transcriptional regulator [Syntrophobacteraceae bacterium]
MVTDQKRIVTPFPQGEVGAAGGYAFSRKQFTEPECGFRGPSDKIRKLADLAKELGLIDAAMAEPERFMPWREAFPEITDENLPGTCLRGARYKEGITQRQLSEMTGIPQRHISEMENAKRPIGRNRRSDSISDYVAFYLCFFSPRIPRG